MVRTTTTTRIVRPPFAAPIHNLSTSTVGSTINSYVMGSPSSTAFISSPAGGRLNSSVSTYIPVQSQPTPGEESMSLIVQLGTTVVASSNAQLMTNTMTVAKATAGTVINRNVNYHEQRTIVNKLSQQGSSPGLIRQTSSPGLHRQTGSTSLSPVTTTRLQIQQQLMTKPSCIVEVQTPKLENIKKEEVQAVEESNSDDNIGEEKRPTYSGQIGMTSHFALQDHNYGAPPPVSPPQSPVPQHSKVNSLNGISGGNSSVSSGSNSYSYGSGLANLRSVTVKKNEEDEDEEDDDANSVISSNPGRDVEPEGEETETAPEGEGDDEDSVTRCICDFEHDDGYMICCDKCFVWQHVDCMGIDRSNIPEEYLCECCQPRRVDKQRARTLQMRKREELLNNDSSSDSSSTSSADTDSSIMNSSLISVRKRSVTSLGRRKSDPVNTTRKNSATPNSTSTSLVKPRQRRDSTTMLRRGSANPTRKREPPSRIVEKRMPMRRKSKSRLSEDEKEEVNPGIAMQQLRQWIDNYEEAVTNHYSPELRARLTSAKANGTHADLKTSSIQNPGSNAAKCKVSQISSGVRILVATSSLSANCPVIEIRGKYMLSGQHKPVSFTGVSSKRSRPPPPGPFLFFYRLPKDGTEVCVDARTYGNDARFVRRSCKPNAELKHCMEKGALHLYIVTLSSVEKNEEITINHFISQELVGQNHMRFMCACGNPRECTAMIRKNGVHEQPIERERRRRGRRAVSSEDDVSNQPSSHSAIVPSDTSPSLTTPARRNSSSVRSPVKIQPTPPPVAEDLHDKNKEVDATESASEKADKKKMTREERKMEAIMKAFERLEKAEQRRQENQAKQAQRKEHDTPRKEIPEVKKEMKEEIQQSIVLPKTSLERPRRRRKKGRRLNSTSLQTPPLSKRRTRRSSVDSDASSGDETSAGCHGIASPSPPHTPVTSINSASNPDISPANRLQTAAGLLLALSNTQVTGISPSYQTPERDTSPSPSLPPPPPPPPAVTGSTPQVHGGVNPTLFSSVCDSGGSGSSTSSQGSTPPTPLSAACLMVAAAVGPLAPGFKFPKTKKVLMNEWLNKSPDPPTTVQSPTLPPLTSPIIPGRPPEPSESIDGYSYKSLATLVQAASRVGMSSPTPSGQTSGRPGGGPGAGSAKKRWLRQAISEECDSPNNNSCPSPNSRAGSPPCPDYVTPLKKRRLARESMSSEQSFTPPTTPTMPGDQSLLNGSPLLKEVSHYEMAASALGMSCEDEDDDIDRSPEDSGTPHTQDEEEEYEDMGVKDGIEQDINETSYRDDLPNETAVGTIMGCALEAGSEEEDSLLIISDATNENNQSLKDKGGEECGVDHVERTVQLIEEEDRQCSDVDPCVKLLSASGEADVSLGVEGTIVVTSGCHEKDELDTKISCELFKAPIEMSEECSANFKKPAGMDSSECEISVRKDSPIAPEETTSVTPAKRKLSISEYRQRKQRTNSCSEQPSRCEEIDNITTSPARIRNRSDSTSSSSSSISSDDARTNKILADSPASLATLPLFLHPDGCDDRKGLGQESVKDGKKKGPPPPPPPPLPPLDSTSSTPLPTGSSHLLNMYSPLSKVHSGSSGTNYPVLSPNNSNSIPYNTSYIPASSSTSRSAVHNGPSYGNVYSGSGPSKSHIYQGFSNNLSAKPLGCTKNKISLYSPNSSTNISTAKSYYLPSSTSCNVPFSLHTQYPSSGLSQTQQVVMVAPPMRGVPVSGTQTHYHSSALSQTGGLQTSSTSQPQTSANPGGSFYTVASAKAYYQSSSRP